MMMLAIPSRNATSSAGPGDRQSTTDSTQRVDHQLKAYIYAPSSERVNSP